MFLAPEGESLLKYDTNLLKLVSKEQPSTLFYGLLAIRKFKEFTGRVILGNLYIEELETFDAGYGEVTPVKLHLRWGISAVTNSLITKK
jgi:hypothetical protein